MIDINKIKVGDKVYYQPVHYADDEWENGIVKEIRVDYSEPYASCFDSVWVVYNCDDKWVDYKNYTSVKTSIYSLYLGWK